ncbi:hypothetical protein BC567DRAFT_216809 [Phyllosticta citribraziliensis]
MDGWTHWEKGGSHFLSLFLHMHLIITSLSFPSFLPFLFFNLLRSIDLLFVLAVTVIAMAMATAGLHFPFSLSRLSIFLHTYIHTCLTYLPIPHLNTSLIPYSLSLI